MSNNNIYGMMNEIETDITEFEGISCSDIETKKIKKRVMDKLHTKKKGRRWTVAACAALGAGLLAVGPFGSQVNAGVKLASYYIGSWFGEEVQSYEECIGEAVTKDGVTVQLNSVVLDGNELTVSTTIDVGQKAGEGEWPSIDSTVYINGRIASYAGGGGMSQEDDRTFLSMMTYSLDKDMIHENEKMDMEIVMQDSAGAHSGTWAFQFTADGAKLNADTVRIPVDQTISLPDGNEVTFTELSRNAMRDKISFRTSGDRLTYNLRLMGTDNLGNTIVFELRESHGNEGYVNVDPNYPMDEGVNVISDEATELTLTPYAAEFAKESGRENDDYHQTGEPFTVNLK